jgi:hypothetical protein
MEDLFYWACFSALCLPVAALVWNQGVGSLVEDTPASRAFRNNYLLVYCMQMREYIVRVNSWRTFVPRPWTMLLPLSECLVTYLERISSYVLTQRIEYKYASSLGRP